MISPPDKPMADAATAQSSAHLALQAIERCLAVLVFSADGTVLRASAKLLQIVGYRARDLIGRPVQMLLPPGGREDAFKSPLWAAIAKGKFREIEHPHVRKDGTVVWLHTSYTPVCDAQGRLVEVVTLATDITASKRQAADDHGHIAAINRFQAVIHFAVDGTVIGANERFLAAMSASLEEVVGAHHRRFVEPAEADSPAYATFWAELAGGHPQAGVYRRLRQDGREVWLQSTYTPIVDMNGDVFKIVEYAIDVTDQKRGRADHEAQIAAIHTSHAVLGLDMRGTVRSANQRFLDAFGYRIDEIEGRHHRMFVDASHAHGPEYAAFWNALADGMQQTGEYRRVGKDGREVWLQASYNPLRDVNGRLFKVVVYANVVTREKLRQADHQGQIASIHKAQCVISFDLDGHVLDANDNFLDTTGYRLKEVRGRHHRMFVDEATAASAEYHAFWADLARGRYHASEFKRRHKDGRDIWLQATYNPIFDMNGRPFKVVKYASDVTEERRRQAQNDSQIAAIHKSQCVATFDMDGTVLDANDNFLVAMGYRSDEVVGRHHQLFVDTAFAQSEAYAAFWRQLRAGEFLRAKFRRIAKGGRQVWFQATYNPIFDRSGKLCKVIKIATDVSADVALAADFVSAKRQAEHDGATALPNRVGLASFMTAALGRPGARLAVLYLDLDHFKPINDTFGHDVGDMVLRETAQRLRQAIEPGQLVARIGGDEFVVAVTDLPDERVDALCQRLIEIVKAPIRHDNVALAVGVSIGVAVSPGDATSAEDLLRCADVALYRSKGSGRGGHSFFAADMHERLSADRHLAEEMRHGIKAGQFVLEVESRFDPHSRALHSALALPRWAHPERGWIAAADFTALAERSGLIVPLGEWLLRAACQAVAPWAGVGVAVRVSATQFAGSDLVQVVDAALAESGLAAARLELELTAQILAGDAGRARSVLAALKARGVRLLLADDGSHHGPLAGMREFGFDAVTVDMRFLADLEAEAGGREIVRELLRVDEALQTALQTPQTPPGIACHGTRLTLGLGTPAGIQRHEVQGLLVAAPLPLPELQAAWAHHAPTAAAAVRRVA